MSQMPNMGVVQILFYQSVIPANIYDMPRTVYNRRLLPRIVFTVMY